MIDAALLVLFPVIALVYSLGGFAGGSSYVLVLTMAGVPHTAIPMVSLTANVAVATAVFLTFRAEGYFRPRLALPFALGSVPAAFLGSQIHLPKAAFISVLALSLAMASLRIFFSRSASLAEHRPARGRLYALGVPLGALMGFLSGMSGIGGGIFLWPTLLLMRWADSKEASAAASFFILVNSFSGLGGRLLGGAVIPEGAWLLACLALGGGLAGSMIGARVLKPRVLERVFAVFLGALSLQFLVAIL